jgi:hypothetical protein
MTRSRFVVSLSGILVGAGALAALGALYLDPARAAVGPLPGFGLALPADTRFVMGVDVQRLTSSSFYQRFAKQQRSLARPDAFKELEEKTGIQPERDLDQLVIAGRGGGPDEPPVVLVRGRFDRTRLSRALETEKKRGVTWKDHAGTTVYLFDETGKRPAAMAFLADDTLILGSAAVIETTLDRTAQGRQPLRDNAGLVALLETVKPGSTVWMVGDQSLLSQLPRTLPAPGGGGGGAGGSVSLPALKSLVVTGDLDPQLSFEVVGEASDEPAARNLADMVRGFVALLSLQASQKPELKDLASAVSVASDAQRVRVSARIPHDLLEALQPKRPPASSPAPAQP